MNMYKTLISYETCRKVQDYLYSLQTGQQPGQYLENRLRAVDLSLLSTDRFVELLMRTRRPKIFAESDIFGDGTDWNQTELSILGDISVAAPVTVYDDGRYDSPSVHTRPFNASLLFTSGALLRSDRMNVPIDWKDVTSNGAIDAESYNRLYTRRLLPPLQYANDTAMAKGKRAFVTIPGLGCKQFSGRFESVVALQLRDALVSILKTYGHRLPCINAVYFDPYNQCVNERMEVSGIQFMVRPSLNGNKNKPQLCSPRFYEEPGDDFSNCLLFSIVDWDPVSWPGNDFYVGYRDTDDGIKAAATNSMAVITRTTGNYDPNSHQYLPPREFRNWKDVVVRKGIVLRTNDHLEVFQ